MENNSRVSIGFISKILNFIRENPSIIFSIILIIFVPLALYFNTYSILRTFEINNDRELQLKAVMVENVLDTFLDADTLKNDEFLKKKVAELRKNEDEIWDLEILRPVENSPGKFEIAAAFNDNLAGQESNSSQNILVWSDPNGIGQLQNTKNGRIWKIEKAIRDSDGKNIGIASLSLSLQKSDSRIADAFTKSYLILIGTIILTLILLLNYARLFKYAVSLTKLKEIDEMKDNFISMASHELRSPLTAMRGYLEFIKDAEEKNLTEAGHKYLANLNISVNRLDNLVDDILEVSRLEQNRVPFEMEVMDPSKIISACLEEMKPKILEKNLELIYQEVALPKIKVDSERLKQILINFIGNAIKYTPRGKIEISAKETGKTLDITVADTGLGISAEAQKNLFQKFYRVKTEETDKIIGTGLGLWITKELVEKMKGAISVESIESVGSHFTISFPIVKEK